MVRNAHGAPGASSAGTGSSSRRDSTAGGGIGVDAERLDPCRPPIRPEVDPHAVHLDAPTPVAAERPASPAAIAAWPLDQVTSPTLRSSRNGILTDPDPPHEPEVLGHPHPSPGRRRSRRPRGTAPRRRAASGPSRPCRRAARDAVPRTCGRSSEPERRVEHRRTRRSNRSPRHACERTAVAFEGARAARSRVRSHRAVQPGVAAGIAAAGRFLEPRRK